ncbi:aspartate/glutamate racemase family protein [Paracoccus benzoatiresistens]|uniref:Aspartate/glutamate racemase family protein n=1 Tax=Paracoccus benzoatiresistens TaxID=2997341 RepID=A0ABT4JBS9_9RHOB|nr:aspartate/glutamate racemase family protein [Paracoccus sp. EF6]MCZ0964359.1 aspartate/glutamate racemase family protein [Paracoccus sp. EF6]
MSRTHRLRTATVSRCISHAAVAVLCLAGTSAAETTPSADSPAIVLINPNSNAAATESMTALAQEAAGDEARILGRTNDNAPRLLTTPEDMAHAVSGVVEIGRLAAAEEEVAAVIVSAFSDPGLAELREALPDTVVVGIGEQAFHEAARDGRSFAIVTITPDPALIESFRAKAEELGYGKQFKGVRVTPGDPKELVEEPEQLDAALAEAVEQAVHEDGAEAVIMGGGPLSAPAMRIQPRFDVPLVVAVTAATKAALKEIAK